MQRILIAAALSLGSVGQAMAGKVAVAVQVPTLDDIGLTALTIVVGIAGGIVARRRKKK